MIFFLSGVRRRDIVKIRVVGKVPLEPEGGSGGEGTSHYVAFSSCQQLFSEPGVIFNADFDK